MTEQEQGIEIISESARRLFSQEDQRSVSILNSLQNSDWFRKVEDDVQLYTRTPEGLVPTEIKFPIGDFLSAVDYYYDNRVMEDTVNDAMKNPNGFVDVYSPFIKGGEERQVVARLKNYFVPQMLEFAYLVVRADQNKDK